MLLCPECEKQQQDILTSPCTECGTICKSVEDISILLSSKDKQNRLFQDYKKLYDQVALDDLHESIQHLEQLQIQADKFISYLPKKPGMSICEIGVGQGWILKKLATLSPSQLVGIDIASPYLIKLLKEKVPFRPFLMNAENLCFQDEFDLVVSTDVMEHVINLGNYLHSINRSLKKGGIFVVRTPYLEDYSGYCRFNGHKYDFQHLRNFSKKTLKIVLEGCGFKVRQIHYDGFMDHLFRSFVPEWVRELFRKYYGNYIKLTAVPNWLGRFFFHPSEIVAVCEKND